MALITLQRYKIKLCGSIARILLSKLSIQELFLSFRKQMLEATSSVLAWDNLEFGTLKTAAGNATELLLYFWWGGARGGLCLKRVGKDFGFFECDASLDLVQSVLDYRITWTMPVVLNLVLSLTMRRKLSGMVTGLSKMGLKWNANTGAKLISSVRWDRAAFRSLGIWSLGVWSPDGARRGDKCNKSAVTQHERKCWMRERPTWPPARELKPVCRSWLGKKEWHDFESRRNPCCHKWVSELPQNTYGHQVIRQSDSFQ